jgi:hypothetical protein
MINKYVLKYTTGALYSISENGGYINIKYFFPMLWQYTCSIWYACLNSMGIFVKHREDAHACEVSNLLFTSSTSKGILHIYTLPILTNFSICVTNTLHSYTSEKLDWIWCHFYKEPENFIERQFPTEKIDSLPSSMLHTSGQM